MANTLSITMEDYKGMVASLDETASQIQDENEREQFYNDAFERLAERFTEEVPEFAEKIQGGSKLSELVSESDKRRKQGLSEGGFTAGLKGVAGALPAGFSGQDLMKGAALLGTGGLSPVLGGIAGAFPEETQRGVETAARAFPGGATGLAIGQDQGAGAIGGALVKDVAQGVITLGLGAKRKAIAATGVGAAVDGMLESLNINKASKVGAKVSQDFLDTLTGTDLPSKYLGFEGLGTAINAITRAPGMQVGLWTEMIPLVISGFAGGKAGEKVGADISEARLAAPTKVPKQLEGVALLKETQKAVQGKTGATVRAQKLAKEEPEGVEFLRSLTGLKRTLKAAGKPSKKAQGKVLERLFAGKKGQAIEGETLATLGDKAKKSVKQRFDQFDVEFETVKSKVKGRPKILQIKKGTTPTVAGENAFNNFMREASLSKTPMQIERAFSRQSKKLDALAKLKGDDNASAMAATIREVRNDSIEQLARSQGPRGQKAADMWLKFKEKNSKIFSTSEAILKSVRGGSEGALDVALLKANMLRKPEFRDAIERSMGKEGFRKYVKVFENVDNLLDVGKAKEVAEVASSISQATLRRTERTGREAVSFLDRILKRNTLKIPRRELEDIISEEKTGISKFNFETRRKIVEGLDELLFVLQQQKSEKE